MMLCLWGTTTVDQLQSKEQKPSLDKNKTELKSIAPKELSDLIPP